MTGFDKPLIALEAVFQNDIFADIFTVILTSIPSRGFHYLSTCIENNRRFHNRPLSRCIGIYRSKHTTTSQSMHLASRSVQRQKCSSIELPNPLLSHIFLPKLLPSVHSPSRTRSRSTPTQPPRYQVKTLSSHFFPTANNLSNLPIGRGEFGRLHSPTDLSVGLSICLTDARGVFHFYVDGRHVARAESPSLSYGLCFGVCDQHCRSRFKS